HAGARSRQPRASCESRAEAVDRARRGRRRRRDRGVTLGDREHDPGRAADEPAPLGPDARPQVPPGHGAEREQAARDPDLAPALAARQRPAVESAPARLALRLRAAQPRRPPTLYERPPEARRKAARRARKAAAKATTPA